MFGQAEIPRMVVIDGLVESTWSVQAREHVLYLHFVGPKDYSLLFKIEESEIRVGRDWQMFSGRAIGRQLMSAPQSR